MPSNSLYIEYADIIVKLVNQGYLKTVKAAGYNNKSINLPNEFYIESKKINANYYFELEKFSLKYGEFFTLDYYFKKSEKKWLEDKDKINMIFEYLKLNGFPFFYATAQERSYDLVGDEKWIDFKGGIKLINALNIKEKLLIQNQNEPAMFAVSSKFIKSNLYKHLIVENKAVYYRLLDLLNETNFSTLIYGAGWRVISGIKDFNKQFPFDGEHEFYYFGDIDYEGIKIYKSINDILEVSLATPFYNILLNEKESYGKHNQVKDIDAQDFFIQNFSNSLELLEKIKLLDSSNYWPQEGLSKIQLKKAWENLDVY